MRLAILLLIAIVSLRAQETTHKTQPKLIRKVEPQYTDEARAARLQGAVVLSLTIEADGVPADIKVFADSAWDWTKRLSNVLSNGDSNLPLTTSAKPVAAKATVEIVFRLS
jgi:hypothetical protein